MELALLWCPFCREWGWAVAMVCPRCGRDTSAPRAPAESAAGAPAVNSAPPRSGKVGRRDEQ